MTAAPLSCLSRRALHLLGEYTIDACIASGALFGFIPPGIVWRVNRVRLARDDTASPCGADNCRSPQNQVRPAGRKTQEGKDHPSRPVLPHARLSRAERRQWDKLVRQLR